MKSRTIRKIRTAVLTGVFIAALALMGAVPQTMQLLPKAAQADPACAAETEYTVFIYSGKEGTFGSPKGGIEKVSDHQCRITGLEYGQSVTVDLADLDLKVKESDKYYIKGLKTAGHDNDEVSGLDIRSYSFGEEGITEDISLSVAYGMAGGMVKYRVNYRDGSGNALHESEEFYGMAGDKPVVAFKHVEGYLPDDYNLTKTLSAKESSNVFTFTYHKVYGEAGATEEGEVTEGDDGDGDGDGNGNGTNGNGNANAGNGNGTLTAGSGDNIPGTNIRDLDENKTPKTTAPIEDNETPGGILSGANALIAGIAAAGVLIALALLYFILRKRREEEEEPVDIDE